jgi:hypothetical protein
MGLGPLGQSGSSCNRAHRPPETCFHRWHWNGLAHPAEFLPTRVPRAAVPARAVSTAFADADHSNSGSAPTRDVTAKCLSPVPKLAPTVFLCWPWQRARRRGRRDRRSSPTCAGYLPITSALKASKRVHAITSQPSALSPFPILRAPYISPSRATDRPYSARHHAAA